MDAALLDVRRRFEGAGIPDAEFEAELLLRHALYATDATRKPSSSTEVPLASRAFVFAHRGSALPADTVSFYERLAQRRLKREPSAYIIGRREFYGLDLLVTPATLIPRPETEVLVAAAIAHLRQGGVALPVLADIGTGSGAVAIAIAASVRQAAIYATDVSSAALAVAAHNSRRLGLERRVTLRRGDLIEPIDAFVDVIAANLPYVGTEDMAALQPEVRWEPEVALVAGADGLDVIRRLLIQAPRYLRPRGAVVLEFGFGQAEAMRALARAVLPTATLSVLPDLAGIDRVLVAAMP